VVLENLSELLRLDRFRGRIFQRDRCLVLHDVTLRGA
jgi:hypothetical protein